MFKVKTIRNGGKKEIKISIAFSIPTFIQEGKKNAPRQAKKSLERVSGFYYLPDKNLQEIKSEINEGKDFSISALKEIANKVRSAVGQIKYKLIQLNKNKMKKIEKVVASVSITALILQTVTVGVFSFFVPSATANDFCVVDVDAVLIMDTSGSMLEGENPSQCDWQELEWVGQSKQCVSHSEEGLTEEECIAKPDPSQCSSPTYTEATQSKMDASKDAAQSFVDNLEPNDQSALVSFSDTATLAKPLSNDHAATKTAIDGLVPAGATNIGDAIIEGTNELSSVRANPQAAKAMILLTDGKANRPFNKDPVDYAIEKAQEAGDLGYKIFTVGLGSNSDINEVMLQDIADITGAQYYHAPNGSDLTAIYDEIAWEICQYGSISGCKYQDLDNNGDIQGEETLADWEITLSGDAELSQLTGEQGCYTFAGLSGGSYTVSESENIDKEPYSQTYPAELSYDIALAEGENLTEIDFGNYLPICGNNILDNDEDCDDGNNVDGDGCSATCQIEEIEPICGNSIVEDGEQCDDGNTEDGDGCSAICEIEQQEPICGNEVVEGNEQCDDGNNVDGDGCSAICEIEEEDIQPGDIVINEIMQNPSAVSDLKGEWLELYNTTSADLNIEGCTIEDNNISHVIIDPLIVPAEDYAVLARNGDSAQNGGIIPDYVYSTLQLSNNDDELILTCNAIEIDRVEYDGGPDFPDPNGASMILSHPSFDNNVGSNWCESSSSFGDGDLGTPGSLNDSCPVVSSIAGSKYNDSDNNGSITGDEKLGDWTIILERDYGGWGIVATATTQIGNSLGNYFFEVLAAGVYRVSEALQNGWLQTYPNNPSYWELSINGDQDIENIDFANYQPIEEPVCGNSVVEDGEQCDDGNTEDGDGCSATCQEEIDETDTAISGCKYNDADNNGQIDPEEEKLGGWTIVLEKQNNESWEEVSTAVTIEEGENLGCYAFEELEAGNYRVSELVSSQISWTQTYPESLSYIFSLEQDQIELNADFANHYVPACGNTILDDGEQCDDGNTEDGDGCSAICEIEQPETECVSEETQACDSSQLGICSVGTQTCDQDGFWGECVSESPVTEICDNQIDDDCDGSIDNDDSDCQISPPVPPGGGGPGPDRLEILDEQNGEILTETAAVVWSTTTWSTSRVVYDTESHSVLSDPPNYGYAFSTDEDVNKVKSHAVVIAGLTPGVTYYWRAISHGSPEVFGDEISFATQLIQGETTGEEEEEEEEEIPAKEEPAEEPFDATQDEPVPEEPVEEVFPGGEVAGEEIIVEEPAKEAGEIEEEETEAKEEITREEESPEGEEWAETQVASGGFLAAVGNIFNLASLCWFLILAIIVLAVLFFLAKKGIKKEDENTWMLLILVAVVSLILAITISNCWILSIPVILLAILLYLAKKKKGQEKI